MCRMVLYLGYFKTKGLCSNQESDLNINDAIDTEWKLNQC